MKWYRADGAPPVADTPIAEIPEINLKAAVNPAGYLPDQGLADAVNVALILRQPLLVTGEPGTGKTQLAFSLAWQLGLDDPFVFEVKSTSLARDLFYTFDNVRRFHAAQAATGDLDARQFIQYNALGAAMLRTADVETVQRAALPGAIVHDGKASVVLIDEIDKAPRDFPNDVLNELEYQYFRIPELGGLVIRPDPRRRPIIIITSNSERALPDPFLRRCIFYHIPFPDDRLEDIVLSRVAGLGEQTNAKALKELLDFFSRLRGEAGALRKKPGTAELLNWASLLSVVLAKSPSGLKAQPAAVAATLSALAKHPEDQARVLELFKAWVHE